MTEPKDPLCTSHGRGPQVEPGSVVSSALPGVGCKFCDLTIVGDVWFLKRAAGEPQGPFCGECYDAWYRADAKLRPC